MSRKQKKLDDLARFLLEHVPEALLLTDSSGHLLKANGKACALYGYSREELLGRTLWELISTENREELSPTLNRPIPSNGSMIPLFGHHHNGTLFPVEVSAHHFVIDDQELVLVRMLQPSVESPERTPRDIELEEELRQRNQELSTLHTIAMAISRDPSVNSIVHNTLIELMRVLNVPFGCLYIRREQKLILKSYRGFSPEEVERLSALDPAAYPWLEEITLVREPLDHMTGRIDAWEKKIGIQAWVTVPMQSKNQVIGAIRLASKNEEHFTSASISLISGVATQVAMALENARLYEQMKESEQRYRSIFENLVVGLYQSSPEGKILTANPAFVRMLGYDSLDQLLEVNIPNDIYVNPADRERYLETLNRTGRIAGVEYQLRRKDGREITVLEHARSTTDAAGGILYYEGMLIDITEKKELEQQLLQAQKMESIGTLAGGVAHDFNNLLTGILGYASLILSQSQPGDPYYQQLRIIEQSAQQAAELTDQLLAFSRQTMSQLRPTDLNALLDGMMPLLRGSLDASIEIQLNREPALWTVEADTRQIQQLLMNLSINARDAMPNGGLLKIETANVVLSQEEARSFVEARPGQFVVLRVSDTGQGIADEHLSRIFDPFFSTKEVNKGTGLGLSTAYGIVKGHNGFIQVSSQLNQGTQFSIYLPATAKSISQQAPGSSPIGEKEETILIVDDEEIVRRLARAILQREGYQVITAAGGPQALQIYQQQGADIALVVLDMTMPKMSGGACYQELRKLDPHVKVMLSSGYSADDAVEDLLDQGVIQFIQKPYRVEELTQAVREAIHYEPA